VFVMWVVMMIGMMMPSAAPMILVHARVGRKATTQGKPFAASSRFAGGHLIAWTAFSLVANSAQWALERAVLLTPTMESASSRLGAAVLILVGFYHARGADRERFLYCLRRLFPSKGFSKTATLM
jgi:predicted metal-binding membrane protein